MTLLTLFLSSSWVLSSRPYVFILIKYHNINAKWQNGLKVFSRTFCVDAVYAYTIIIVHSFNDISAKIKWRNNVHLFSFNGFMWRSSWFYNRHVYSFFFYYSTVHDFPSRNTGPWVASVNIFRSETASAWYCEKEVGMIVRCFQKHFLHFW